MPALSAELSEAPDWNSTLLMTRMPPTRACPWRIDKSGKFEAMAEAVTVLMNSTMVAERSECLGAAPYIVFMNAIN